MGNRWGNSGNSVWLYFLELQITADGDCSHEIKRRLLLGRKAMTNLDSILKSRDITWSKCGGGWGCQGEGRRSCRYYKLGLLSLWTKTSLVFPLSSGWQQSCECVSEPNSHSGWKKWVVSLVCGCVLCPYSFSPEPAPTLNQLTSNIYAAHASFTRHHCHKYLVATDSSSKAEDASCTRLPESHSWDNFPGVLQPLQKGLWAGFLSAGRTHRGIWNKHRTPITVCLWTG